MQVPEILIHRLRQGGILLIPVGEVDGIQSLMMYAKDKEGFVKEEKVMDVRYVPLTTHTQQLARAAAL
jgi:protein-L-isoaspartate O-methyltransferase